MLNCLFNYARLPGLGWTRAGCDGLRPGLRLALRCQVSVQINPESKIVQQSLGCIKKQNDIDVR